MTLIGKTSHALFFNGVSDAVVVPQALFSKTGMNVGVGGKSSVTTTGHTRMTEGVQSEHTTLGRITQSFTIEAWVIPDCGGVIASKEGMFDLRMGEVGTPGPAQFMVQVFNANLGQQTITVSSASPFIAASAQNGWDGIVYPTHGNDSLQGTFNRFNGSKNNESALNRNHRELYHIVGVFTGEQVKLYVNGELVASQKLQQKMPLNHNANDLYIGGKGGEFRGTIEGLHIRRGFNESAIRPAPIIASGDTIALWRFEEPVEVPSLELNLNVAATASTSASGSTLTINNAQGKLLVEYLTGQTPTEDTIVALDGAPYTNGKYQVSTAGAIQAPDHLPINLLINPTGVDEKTGVAYQTSPPERVRLKTVTWDSDGTTNTTLQVYSIHLDFSNSTTTGLRGLLHAHAAFDATNQKALGSMMVVINSDLLVDSGTGKPLRPPGYGTQAIDRTGQMVIDEVGANHGFMFNQQLATNTTTNPYAFNWGASAIPDGFQAGHTGRHLYSHVTGHPFLRHLPPAEEEVVVQRIDGDNDRFSASFDGAATGLKDQLPIGSIVDIHRQGYMGKTMTVESSSTITAMTSGGAAVENGMVGVDSTQRNLIAIGGAGFNPTPFLLKGHALLDENISNATYDLHLTPEDEPRVAILEVPGLSANNIAPYVEIHYNAIDLKGSTIQYAASGIATTGWDNVNHRATLATNAVKAFGAHNDTFDGYYLTCGGERAYGSTGTVTFTVNHTNNRLDATGGGASVLAAFEAQVNAAGALIQLELRGPALCVTKTIPDAATIITGTTQVADLIQTAITAGTTIHAPGGMIRIDDKDIGTGSVTMDDHRLVGDNTGGTTFEIELDKSMIPSNHMPNASTDSPQLPPQGVVASHVATTTHPSTYHKLIVRPLQSGASAKARFDPPVTTAPNQFILSPLVEASSNANGAFDTPASNHRTHLHESYDIIDNWVEGKSRVFVVQPTIRSRTMQLSKFVGSETNFTDTNFVSIEYLLMRGRIKSFQDVRTTKRSLLVRGIGLMDDVKGVQASFTGDASPDSHPVKEISPGGPVVAVSLGGPGQGAINTKPTYDPSPIARIGWNTRRPCGATISAVDVGSVPKTIYVQPMNNNSESLATWGHICFPPGSGSGGTGIARIHLANGASAAYYDIIGRNFAFDTTDTNMVGWFINADGTTESTFANWVAINTAVNGKNIYVDPYIGDDTVCEDGTTIQDRLFQKLGSVTHDYQLGTQYASTRALVEIPLFPYHFFEDRDKGIFPGPDNSMRINLDATLTAQNWCPNPVGRRPCGGGIAGTDTTVVGPYGYQFTQELVTKGTIATSTISKQSGHGNQPRLFVDNIDIFPDANDWDDEISINRRGGGTITANKVFLENGEWAYYCGKASNYLILLDNDTGESNARSGQFFESLEVGMRVSPTMQTFDDNVVSIADDNRYSVSEAQEFRSPYYHDMANVQTQGGNVDYGLKQYVSAVEFKDGPRENPHLPKLEAGRWSGNVKHYGHAGGVSTILVSDDELFPEIGAMLRYGAKTIFDWKVLNLRTGAYLAINYTTTFAVGGSSANPLGSASGFAAQTWHPRGFHKILTVKNWTSYAAAVVPADIKEGDDLLLVSLEVNPNNGPVSPGAYADTFPKVIDDAVLNASWLFPYASGGLRSGDTVWMNMHYTNPHATEGMFCKSRGVLDEGKVWNGFNGGSGLMTTRSRSSTPLENFLIGNTCRETAENFAQHVNKTIELNLKNMSHPSVGRIVAFVDPYLSKDTHARVLLYDVKGDRELVAFNDLHMQVQSSPDAIKIDNLDVAYGFTSQQLGKDSSKAYTTSDGGGIDSHASTGYLLSPKVRGPTGTSTFIEGAYAHIDQVVLNVDRNDNTDTSSNALMKWELTNLFKRNYEQGPTRMPSTCSNGRMPLRTQDAACCLSEAQNYHGQGLQDETEAGAFWTPAHAHAATAVRFNSITFDTPNGTRAIPAFLCLKGIRAVDSTTTDADLSNLPHWKQMDFVRRLSIDLGEIGLKEGVTNIESAAREIVRYINQAGAKQGRSNIRRPPDQYPGKSLDGDPAFAHIAADYAVTGSTHDPASFWDDEAFSSYDRGSHMGYLRAHIGRVIEDTDGVEGFTVVIHSTIPGATGRNFCAWLDNSRGQAPYKPQFLVGHGGRFRNFYCQPDEKWGECMHPAPMPIDKNGKPFAPITTLHEMTLSSEPSTHVDDTQNRSPTVQESFVATEGTATVTNISGNIGAGSASNTVGSETNLHNEAHVIQGLRVGTQAHAQINCGGLVASGIPGWSPDLGTWGFGDGENSRAHSIYSSNGPSAYTTHVPSGDMIDVGDSQMYAFQFTDHLKRNHNIRMVYKQYGKVFSSINTKLPSSLENEVVIWFDDRNVGDGGFTIGKHMKGIGDAANRIKTGHDWKTGVALSTIGNQNYCGNRWNGVPAHEGAYAVTVVKPAAGATTLRLQSGAGTVGSFGRDNAGIWHDLPDGTVDVLGYLGFPKENGVMQVSVPKTGTLKEMGNSGYFVSYTHRTTAGKAGPHSFFGCEGLDTTGLKDFAAGVIGPTQYTDAQAPVCISPTPNWTTLVTDELIAAAVEYALTMGDPNSDEVGATSFDCTEMYTGDGRTFGEWGVSSTAIRVKAYSNTTEVIAPRHLFEVNRQPDWGILDAHVHETQVSTTISGTAYLSPIGALATSASTRGLLNSVIDAGQQLSCGYIPKTVLHITTRYRGTNANTATPVIIDSDNNPINTDIWKQNLRGERYTYWPGDHILPRAENPATIVDGNTAASTWTITLTDSATYGVHQAFHFAPVGRAKAEDVNTISPAGSTHVPFYTTPNLGEDASYSERYTVWFSDREWCSVEAYALDVGPVTDDYGARHKHVFNRDIFAGAGVLTAARQNSESEDFDSLVDAAIGQDMCVLALWGNRPLLDGMRTTGSNKQAEPYVYFRGARDSPDHSVPLYFGGGFSGAVMDINDGTQNDYTDFYTHPYSSGPTGCAGIQNANELMGSHCILDTTAMLAMFPGTAYLDQHKGVPAPPFYNQDMQLSPDMAQGAGNVPTATDTPDDDSGSGGYLEDGQTVVQTQPSPVVLRFAHPFGRYEDAQSATVKTSTTYLIFGPGQSVPHFFQTEYDTYSAPTSIREPSVGMAVGGLHSVKMQRPAGAVPSYPYHISGPTGANALGWYGTPSYAYLPNEISHGHATTWATGTKTVGLYGWSSAIGWMPPTTAYQVTNTARWQGVDNWEPAQGDPNAAQYNQAGAEYGRYLSDHFLRHDGSLDIAPTANIWSFGSVGNAHPFTALSQSIVGASHATPATGGAPTAGPVLDFSNLHADATAADISWHMDGGHAPGGHFFDDRVVRNPNNFGVYSYPWRQSTDMNGTGFAFNAAYRVGDNAAMFRVGAPMLRRLVADWGYAQDNYSGGVEGDVDRDVIIIDATRVQNSEELGAVISCAINEWPGSGALKALGGTFLPSFQHAHKQDRYSWVQLPMETLAGTGSLNGRADHLTHVGAVSTHFEDPARDAGMSLSISGSTYYMPPSLPYVGWARFFLDTAGAVQRYVGADTSLDTVASMNDRGFYGFYRGVARSDDTGVKATGANRSIFIGRNYRTGMRIVEDPTVDATKRTISGPGSTYPGHIYLEPACHVVTPDAAGDKAPVMHIWTKTGNHRWDNGGISNQLSQLFSVGDSSLSTTQKYVWDALAGTHVHFNGLTDAIDRTRPIGAIGWHGERYSMLNSLGIVEKGYWGISRGLGAWHPFLSFSPYGSGLNCHYSNYIGQYSTTAAAAAAVQYGSGWMNNMNKTKGTHEHHFVVISHEGELPLIARADRLGQSGCGDFLSGIWDTAPGGSSMTPPGFADTNNTAVLPRAESLLRTTAWSNDIHNPSRYWCPANGGPYVEAQVVAGMDNPTTNNTKRTNMKWGAVNNDGADNALADNCAAQTGDLFTSKEWLGMANALYQDTNGLGGIRDGSAFPGIFDADNEPHRYWHDPLSNTGKTSSLNFGVNHIVWKRMDGGNLSLPAPNARGLGAVPWTWRKQSGTTNYYKTGETTYGNCRFSFETTNSAMFPVIQAQELAHPQLAERFPHLVRNALIIPNEDIQFESMVVIDDTGQEHTIEGGSPFGSIIRDFKEISDRSTEGLAPALGGSGNSPNMRIQLPDPNTIPGNIVVRSGFDRLQAYQNESIGTGGLQHPGQPTSFVSKAFDGSGPDVATWPTWENNNWEQISVGPSNNSADSKEIGTSHDFPDSFQTGWDGATNDAPLQTAYEPHDRTLYFHITKMDISYSKREDVGSVEFLHRTPVGGSATNLVVRDNITVNQTVFTGVELVYDGTVHYATVSGLTSGPVFGNLDEQLNDGTGRWFLVATNSAGKVAIASYTGITTGSTKFTGVVFGPGWDSTFDDATIHPSYYTPAGTTRLFAARRLRDHAEISGDSPDMPRIEWHKLNAGTSDNPYTLITAPKLTPMPIPRMGHHYVNATMAMMPGHLAHPLYQGLYRDHLACAGSAYASLDSNIDENSGNANALPTMDPNIWFSNLTPNYAPSDIHGGAFTLMTETKVRFDGYGILASSGVAGVVNSKGGHVIILEAANQHTQTSHFPDPLEVGAYQIIIQPNIFSQQITGFHENTPFGDTTSPRNAADGAFEADLELNLTGQQVATVVGVVHDWATYGGSSLILADTVSADVRGCEIYINEVMLDIDPAPGQQFTSLPPLANFNPLGVNETMSPPFTRRSLPYHPTAFKRATPGYTLTIPWWAIGVQTGNYSGLTLFGVDDYYLFNRSTLGAISAQITLAGYPTHFYEPYTRELQSLNPRCKVVANPTAAASVTLSVDDNALFPLNGATYGRKVVTIDSAGTEHFATYTARGTSGASTGDTDRFLVFTPADGLGASSPIWNVLTSSHSLYNGGTLRLMGAHNNFSPGDNYTDQTISPLPRTLPQLLSGTRDTNSLHMADAYLCMWHHNLGRPYTKLSDGSHARGRNDAYPPVNKKPYNIMPESFEMVHYHEFSYAISNGPFALGMKGMSHRSVSGTSTGAWDNANHRATLTGGHVNNFGADGGTFDGFYLECGGARAYTAPGTVTFTITYGTNRLTATSGGTSVLTTFEAKVISGAVLNLIQPSLTNAPEDPDSVAPIAPTVMPSGAKFFYGGFWPGGTRYGASASRLDMWGDVERGWNVADPFSGSCIAYTAQYNAGPALDPMEIRTDQTVTAAWANFPTTPNDGVPWTRNYCFGYRFSVRQPYNRPKWAIAIKSVADAASGSHSNGHYAYFNGPFVQAESGTWTSRAVTPNNDTATLANGTITGIIERQTNASALLSHDLPTWQVRYSDGRRMTRPFGCPIRVLRNDDKSRRLFPGDHIGKSIEDLVKANMYYVVDWWGNTTGEDVRRFPVRGFGVRPAFDPEAWRYVLPFPLPATSLFFMHPDTVQPPSVQQGNRNESNNAVFDAVSSYYTKLADFFNPIDSVRVGDRGDGRGSRYPVFFNEYILQDVDTTMNPIGMVMSYHTAEPPFTTGLLRPRNDALQDYEVPRGISGRLGISDTDGLLKPEGMVGANVEQISGVFGAEGLSFYDPVSRLSPRIGLDSMTVTEASDNDPRNYIVQATQATSLHTDREVGQRYIFQGSFETIDLYSSSGVGTIGAGITHLDMSKTAGTDVWADGEGGVLRFNNAHGVSPMGGNYIMEVSSHVEPFNDYNWGIDTANAAYVLSTFGPTSNPYQGNATAGVNDPMRRRTNATDKTIRFLLRVCMTLDSRHIALFRPRGPATLKGPQSSSHATFFKMTGGCRYGLFNYDMPNARAVTSGRYVQTTNPSPTSGPYVASYIPDHKGGTSFSSNKSHGPYIRGAGVDGTTPTLADAVARLIISENTLQHYRSDASRRQGTEDDDGDVTVRYDYTVEPRHSQTLHPKGEDATTDFNTADHDDDTPDDYYATGTGSLRTVDY